MTNTVKLSNFVLDEIKASDGTLKLVLRGILSAESFGNLLYDNDEANPQSYQRTVIAGSKRREDIRRVYVANALPSVVLGMRGENFDVKEGYVILQDPIYVIDGQQRISVGMEMMQEDPSFVLSLLAIIHLNSSNTSERRMFEDLNTTQSRVSQGLLIKNARTESPLIDAIVKMSQSPDFALHGRVAWGVNSTKKEDLILGTNLLGVVSSLHRHMGVVEFAGGHQQFVTSTSEAIKFVSCQKMVSNTGLFISSYVEAFSVLDVAYRDKVSFLRPTFIKAVCMVIDKHENFWRGDTLQINQGFTERLGRFKYNDPSVKELSITPGGSSVRNLASLILSYFHESSRKKDAILILRKKGLEAVIDREDDQSTAV